MIQLLQECMNWAVETFPHGTALSSLQKANDEISELTTELFDNTPDLRNPHTNHKELLEYADVIICILFSAAKRGYTANEVMTAFTEKFGINKKREWKKNDNNTYSHI